MSRERGRIVVCETCMDVEVEAGTMHRLEGLIAEARSVIGDKIRSDPFFGTTYEPYGPRRNDDPLIIRMCEASVAAGVGPMASVAGAVDAYVMEAIVSEGCAYAVLNNGGDIALLSDTDVRIGLYSCDAGSCEYAMDVPGTGKVLGICSSSGRMGHSVSFGDSDICTVISKDPVSADAFATRLGNEVRHDGDIRKAALTVGNSAGVDGCIAISGGRVAVCGDVPEMLRMDQV